MKLFSVVRRVAVGSDQEQLVTQYYVASHISKVIETMQVDLMDEATEVVHISGVEKTGMITVLV